ncbi:hypothetical protein JCM24511_05256 [Saitozyma sp. JCM 24511]|nr:hypothetical protein JCM24511_05256 [Saitozyma sp. JCM 24511]
MSSSWLVKAVIGHHKTVGNKEVHADHQPLHSKPRHDGDVRLSRHDRKQISQLTGTGKDPNEVLHVHLGLHTNSVSELSILPSEDLPTGLVPSDRWALRCARGLSTGFDQLLTIRTPKIMGYSKQLHFGAGILLEEIPLVGPTAQELLGICLFYRLHANTGVGGWLFWDIIRNYICVILVSYLPLLGSFISSYMRPIFSGCRLIILFLKLRSMMFEDQLGDDGLWHSDELADFFGLKNFVYSKEVRTAVMGENDKYLGSRTAKQGLGMCC